ncbi:hypothetical protein HOD08_01625, partial [bacterium]|nr:hypothetical protein [bacterium]
RELTLSDAEAIVVGHGKTLTIQDVRLDKLGGTSSAYPNNIRCLGSDSKVIFRNVEAVLESSFSFTVGAIDVEHDFSIDGFGKTFAYSSASNLTVKSRSMLMLDRGVTFSYDSSSAANDKLVFEDSSSTLKMFGSTLYSTHTGVSLSTGRLEVNDLCIFESEADNSAEAMIINTDLDVRVRAGAALDMRGMIVYE